MHFTRERAALLASSTVAFGLAALMRKISVDRISPFHYQTVSACVYAFFLPVSFWAQARFAPAGTFDPKGVAWAVVGTIIASLAGISFGFALRSGNDAGVVTALSSLSPIVTMMLSFALLGERPSLASAVGCALVLAGVAIISLRG